MKRLIFISLLVIFAGCKKETMPIDRPPIGAARVPVANAGPDIVVELPLFSPVKLNSSESVNFANREWRKLSGPDFLPFDSVFYDDADLGLWQPGIYSFELSVGNRSIVSKDTVNIVVKNSTICGDIPETVTMLSKNTKELSISDGTAIFLTVDNQVVSHNTEYYLDEPSRRIAIYDIPSEKLETFELENSVYQTSVANTSTAFYMAGGYKNSSTSNSFYSDNVSIYDKNLHIWSNGKLSEAREQLTSISAGDLVFFAGGYNSSGPSATVDIYNQLTKKWTSSKLSEARQNMLAITNGLKIYFAGGTQGDGLSNKIDIYDIATGLWSVEQLTDRLYNLKGFFADDKVYFAGYRDTGSKNKVVVEIKDLNGHPLGMSCLPTGISGGTQEAILSTDQFIMVPGFALSSYASMINLFDKKTGKWKLLVPQKSGPLRLFPSDCLITYNNKIYGLVTNEFTARNTQYLFTIDL